MDASWLDQCLERWEYVPEGPYKLTVQTGAAQSGAQSAAATAQPAAAGAAPQPPLAAEAATGALSSAPQQQQGQEGQDLQPAQQQHPAVAQVRSQTQTLPTSTPASAGDPLDINTFPATLENLSSLRPAGMPRSPLSTAAQPAQQAAASGAGPSSAAAAPAPAGSKAAGGDAGAAAGMHGSDLLHMLPAASPSAGAPASAVQAAEGAAGGAIDAAAADDVEGGAAAAAGAADAPADATTEGAAAGADADADADAMSADATEEPDMTEEPEDMDAAAEAGDAEVSQLIPSGVDISLWVNLYAYSGMRVNSPLLSALCRATHQFILDTAQGQQLLPAMLLITTVDVPFCRS